MNKIFIFIVTYPYCCWFLRNCSCRIFSMSSILHSVGVPQTPQASLCASWLQSRAGICPTIFWGKILTLQDTDPVIGMTSAHALSALGSPHVWQERTLPALGSQSEFLRFVLQSGTARRKGTPDPAIWHSMPEVRGFFLTSFSSQSWEV